MCVSKKHTDIVKTFSINMTLISPTHTSKALAAFPSHGMLQDNTIQPSMITAGVKLWLTTERFLCNNWLCLRRGCGKYCLLSFHTHINRPENKYIFCLLPGVVVCVPVLMCEEKGFPSRSVCACGKWKVNVETIGLYLPAFFASPATLTVQSQDNWGETNAAFRQSNAPPP